MNTPPLQVLILTVAGGMNRSQQDVIDYLREENRAFREQVGDGRLKTPMPVAARIPQSIPEPPQTALAAVGSEEAGPEPSRRRPGSRGITPPARR
jgi:hypothetical protein